MKPVVALLLTGCLAWVGADGAGTSTLPRREGQGANSWGAPAGGPLGQPGQVARYRLQGDTVARASDVTGYTLALGPVEQRPSDLHQWLVLAATKAGRTRFRVWLLSTGYPSGTLGIARSSTARYILQEGDSRPLEFRDRMTQRALLPSMGGWQHLMPRPLVESERGQLPEVFPKEAGYLGHRYVLEGIASEGSVSPPRDPRIIQLQPDALIGMPSNTRQKDERRRYDNSDYELVRLTRDDYRQMVQAGISCLKVDAEQLPWVEDLDAFYWGPGPNELPYPEFLYRSSFLGPVLFLDEPAVGTRDHVIRPRLAKDPAFRKTVNPQLVFEAFQDYFRHALRHGPSTTLLAGLKARPDVDIGEMDFPQENLFTWETMVSSAAYQLSQDPSVPAAMVFEPPGRVGTLRTLPELDMTYGCQLAVANPKNLTDIIYGFLRGAARLTGKAWGTSIYGAVDRADAFWFLTHAYDLGATRFFFWDNAKTACVPYGECLALVRNLRAHAENYPFRDLQQLSHAAEVAILLPPGYNLGHVHLGKGSLWGLTELNLERLNRKGVKYRTVMSNFFTEIERCIRLGVAFDLLWDLPGPHASGYREVVRIREDGSIEVNTSGRASLLRTARTPVRPQGIPPLLGVELSPAAGKAPVHITAHAKVIETSAPVYYTYGADTDGVYHNALVAWELYGPDEEDCRFLMPENLKPTVEKKGAVSEVTIRFLVRRPGHYRLRAATVDLAGRTTVVWTPITVTE